MKKFIFKKIIKAFSILELMLVLAIIIILFSVSVPKLSFVNRFLVENEVDKMFTIFSFLQQRAIASNQEQEIIFDLKQSSYFYDLGENDGSNGSIPRQGSKPSRWPAVALAKASRFGWQAGLPRTGETRLASCKLPDAVKFGFLPGVNGPPSSPSKPITSPISFKSVGEGKYKVTFFVDGKIQPGTVYFVDKNHNFMMALTCPISQVSFVRKYRYDQVKWVCLK